LVAAKRSHALDIERTLSLLAAALDGTGVCPVAYGQLDMLARFLRELERFQQHLRLVSELNPEGIALLLLEGLAVGNRLETNARVLDIGPGGGFPGIPMAILRTDASFVLVERRRRIATYLEHVAQTLGLKHVHVLWVEFEKALSSGELGRVQEITAKAVWSWQEYVCNVLPLVEKGARAWVFGTPSLGEEAIVKFLKSMDAGNMSVSSFDARLLEASPTRRLFALSLSGTQKRG
jgi:16S rRNA (guanine(527)-N(7))-methyltransferase RsmG